MVWSSFRASDDMQKFSFHIPDNMYVVGSLLRLVKINAAVWQDPWIATTARALVEDMRRGIEQYGMVTLQVRSMEV